MASSDPPCEDGGGGGGGAWSYCCADGVHIHGLHTHNYVG